VTGVQTCALPILLSKFSAEDKSYMIKDGQVEVTCEFCNTTYRFDPPELE